MSPTYTSDQHLTAPVIRHYVAGELTARQQYAVERHCAGCGLCQEALTEYEARAPRADHLLGDDLAQLRRRLGGRHAPRRLGAAAAQPWLVAATLALLLLAGAAWLVVSRARPVAQSAAPTADVPVDTLVLYQKPAVVLVSARVTTRAFRADTLANPAVRQPRAITLPAPATTVPQLRSYSQ